MMARKKTTKLWIIGGKKYHAPWWGGGDIFITKTDAIRESRYSRNEVVFLGPERWATLIPFRRKK